MSANQIIFYLIAFMIIAGGILAVTSKYIFRSAVFLLASLLGVAGLYFYLEYEFVAAVQIVVYAGGIVVLIIFSIFLTYGSGEKMKSAGKIRMFSAALLSLAVFVLTFMILHNYTFNAHTETVTEASVGNIGKQMLSLDKHGYILPFEVISLLLLAAMVGCIAIAAKAKKKQQ